MSAPRLTLDVVLPCGIRRAWAALTDPAALARWLLPNDFLPFVGHRFTFRARNPGDWPREIHCAVVSVQEPHRLVISWQGDPREPATLVSFSLAAAPGGTRLRLEHAGARTATTGVPGDDAQRRPLPHLLRLHINMTALRDEALRFVREPRAATRNALPLVAKLRQAPAVGVPVELLESMVLDGVEESAFVAQALATVTARRGVSDVPLVAPGTRRGLSERKPPPHRRPNRRDDRGPPNDGDAPDSRPDV